MHSGKRQFTFVSHKLNLVLILVLKKRNVTKSIICLYTIWPINLIANLHVLQLRGSITLLLLSGLAEVELNNRHCHIVHI